MVQSVKNLFCDTDSDPQIRYIKMAQTFAEKHFPGSELIFGMVSPPKRGVLPPNP